MLTLLEVQWKELAKPSQLLLEKTELILVGRQQFQTPKAAKAKFAFYRITHEAEEVQAEQAEMKQYLAMYMA